MMEETAVTPALRQYREVKEKYPDCLILFRMGDFYETFYEDAKTAARELEITLTSRGKDEKKAPLAGIPYHALESYLARLIKKGYKVAICEQVEDPRFAKGIVKREVVRIVTPGTVIDSSMLDEKNNNYIMALNVCEENYAAALCDLSTGEFFVCPTEDLRTIKSMIAKYAPSECILPTSLAVNKELLKEIEDATHVELSEDRHFRFEPAYETLKKQLQVITLEGFGMQEDRLAITAAGALLSYLYATQFKELTHIRSIKKKQAKESMVLDATTLRNLEIITARLEKEKTGSLLYVLDKTTTSMGARLLKKWIAEPLLDIAKIQERQDAVEVLKYNTLVREELKKILKSISDLERLLSRVNYGNATPRDVVGLKSSLQQLPHLQQVVHGAKKNALLLQVANLPDLQILAQLLEEAILPDAPLSIREGGIIRPTFNSELKKLSALKNEGKSSLLEIEQREKEKTGIKSLKISFNRVFGYYIEVSKTNLHLVPQEYIRKQTTVNYERFITPELKEFEELVLHAQEKMQELEYEIYISLLDEIKKKTDIIQEIAQAIATVDVLVSFAQIAVNNNYTKPEITKEDTIELLDARHPVIETIEKNFIPNDIILHKGEMMLITGPNMAGKSTIMRQVALNVLLAQVGSFVAAKKAKIGLVDRIFTRVGAHDDLTKGQSTFMVEMTETANILHQATAQSLIILDEIGRGTSTYDGVAIAWSVAEYIYNKIKAKTLFATHYHVLNKLEEEYTGVTSYNLAVKETDEEILFLRKLIRGGTDKSYGVHVGKIAGLPREVIERAKEIQETLAEKDRLKSKIYAQKEVQQQTLFVPSEEYVHGNN